jgi:hypothetical protein
LDGEEPAAEGWALSAPALAADADDVAAADASAPSRAAERLFLLEALLEVSLVSLPEALFEVSLVSLLEVLLEVLVVAVVRDLRVVGSESDSGAAVLFVAVI